MSVGGNGALEWLPGLHLPRELEQKMRAKPIVHCTVQVDVRISSKMAGHKLALFIPLTQKRGGKMSSVFFRMVSEEIRSLIACRKGPSPPLPRASRLSLSAAATTQKGSARQIAGTGIALL
jgi:hypothetical protein